MIVTQQPPEPTRDVPQTRGVPLTRRVPQTRRVSLTAGGAVFDLWTRIEVVRDLGDIAGSFTLELVSPERGAEAWPWITAAAPMPPHILPGMAAAVAIDGETVLTGWIDDVTLTVAEGDIGITVQGRDRTGDLVDCAAAPDGPAEFHGLDVLGIARAIAGPFGIPVEADAPAGPPFERFAIDAGETAMSAIEKAARQRQLLVVSDGLGALRLTRGGGTRAPAPLSLPGTVTEARTTLSWRERFSRTTVKGQAERAGGARAATAPLDSRADPLDAPPAAPAAKPQAGDPAGNREAGGVTLRGEAADPEIARHRPTVLLARTQSTAASIQGQAEWAQRVARDTGETLDYSVMDWRAGPGRALWRPNTLVAVDDAYADIRRDMLIAGVRYSHDEGGTVARLRLTGPDAYDVEPVGERRRNRPRGQGRKARGPLDGTARAL